MRRRWMSAILALTMALALTACGGDSSSSSIILYQRAQTALV